MAVAVARFARHTDRQRERTLAAEQRLADAQFDLGLGICALRRGRASRPATHLRSTTAAPAEHVAEHLCEEVREATAAHARPTAGTAEHPGELFGADVAERTAARGRLEVLAVAPVLAERVEALALLGVAQYLVGFGDGLEAILDLLAFVRRMAVGMPFLRQLAVGALDVVGARRARNAEGRVVVLELHSGPAHRSRRRPACAARDCDSVPPKSRGASAHGDHPRDPQDTHGLHCPADGSLFPPPWNRPPRNVASPS